MKGMPGVMNRFYRFLLRLYPPHFRSEFEEQMLFDFSDLAKDAGEKGKLSLSLFYLHEIVQFPASLLYLYVKEAHTFGIFQRPPVNNGLRAAVAFGVTLASYYTLEWLTFIGLEPLATNEILDEQVIRKAILLLGTIRSLLGGLVLGSLLAVFFAERSHYSRFTLVSMFLWFLNDAVFYVFENLKGSYFDDTPLGLSRTFRLLLSGVYFSLIFGFLTGEKPKPVHWPLAAALVHPVLVYFYLQFEWLGMSDHLSAAALIVLLAVVIGSVLLIARRSDDGGWTIFMVAGGMAAYPLLVIMGVMFTYGFSFPGLPDRINFDGPYSSYVWPLVGMALARAAGGMLFGFWLGFLSGAVETHRPGEVPVET